MLLRKTTKHLTNQNWFAVFIDFIIVVAGVFIGIQAANWNDARVEAKREQEVLVAVLDDLKNDLRVLETSLGMAQVSIDTSIYIIGQAGFKTADKISMPIANFQIGGQEFKITTSEPIPENQKDQLWKMVTVRYYPQQSNTAFNSLIAAGDLKIISDQSLIRELQSYSLLWKSIEDSNETTYKTLRDRTVFFGQEYGLSPFSVIPEKELISMVQNNPKFVAVVRTMLEFTVLHKLQMEQAKKHTMSLIDQIEKEIK